MFDMRWRNKMEEEKEKPPDKERLYRIKLFSEPTIGYLELRVNNWIQSNFGVIRVERIWGSRSSSNFVMVVYTVDPERRDKVVDR
jgi:hypothetical protein